MSKGPFDLEGILGGHGKSLATGARIGTQIGRTLTGWSLRRRLEQEGFDPITIGAATEAVAAGRKPDAILEQARQAYALRDKQEAIRRDPPPVHGSARWATAEEVEAAGLLRAVGKSTLNLGTAHGRPVNWDGESHLLTVAPTRTGKSAMQVIPNLRTYGGSAVVLDPKGEIYEHTAAWRKKLGPVYVLNPFDVEGMPATNAFNPLDGVTDSQSALELAEILYPRTLDDRQQFFENEAIGFLAAVVEFTARYAPQGFRSLGTIRDTVSTLDGQLHGLLKAMSDDVMPDSVRNAARNFQTKSRETGQPRVLDSLNTHLRIWDTPGLRRATARSEFDFERLKNAPATVYLVLPFAKITPFSTYVRIVFASALDAMIRTARKPDIPVLFVLDEFLSLAPDDRFVSALRTHASAGVRLWFFLQDLPTLEQKYPTNWKSFLQVETKTFFGTDDPYTADLISRYLGDRTVTYDVPNVSGSMSGGASPSTGYSISDNLHLAARRLMTPDEVIAFLRGSARGRKAIHFLRDLPHPLQTDLTPWFLETLPETNP
ncbi:type IV secretion system protein VirD4 [Breoghania corrubedonensis]|uniref:Type IV secretion system protein VirD4 n=1 Tax=Breoghania corrubedonensis TaxID=665038 RepID=A0A2T5VD75_9HYPH|nr:type IV secretory system conjugative DNA transfer family protein [Breoghania corrubedonensis]PTW61692.1 type IV secretion system protein VirD4 [Breoghania corrubedonensis]